MIPGGVSQVSEMPSVSQVMALPCCVLDPYYVRRVILGFQKAADNGFAQKESAPIRFLPARYILPFTFFLPSIYSLLMLSFTVDARYRPSDSFLFHYLPLCTGLLLLHTIPYIQHF
jgi:hypothetical protein